MRTIITVLVVIAGIGAYFLAWHFMMQPHVARVKASMAHHAKLWEATIIHHKPPEPSLVKFPMVLRAESVHASGFPFRFRLKVEKPVLSITEFDETFEVSTAEVVLTSTDSSLGIYAVEMPAVIEATFAKKGAAPEHYTVVVEGVPKVNFSAQDSKKRCGFGTDQICTPAAADAPLISYAVGFPSTVVLHVTLNGKTRDATFNMPAIQVPIYQSIPDDISRVQELFVHVLRELMVYNSPDPVETITSY